MEWKEKGICWVNTDLSNTAAKELVEFPLKRGRRRTNAATTTRGWTRAGRSLGRRRTCEKVVDIRQQPGVKSLHFFCVQVGAPKRAPPTTYILYQGAVAWVTKTTKKKRLPVLPLPPWLPLLMQLPKEHFKIPREGLKWFNHGGWVYLSHIITKA